MSAQRNYIITTSVAGVTRSEFWDASSPHILGDRLGWNFMENGQGVRLKHHTGEVCDIAPEIIMREDWMKLPLIGGQEQIPILFKIRRAGTVLSAFQTGTNPREGARLNIYICQGTWVQDSIEVSGRYMARKSGQKLFTLTQKPGRVSIQPHTSGLVLHRGGQAMHLDASVELSADEMPNIAVSSGEVMWRFGFVVKPLAPPETNDKKDRESLWFWKVLLNSFLLFVLFFGVSFWVVDKTDENLEEEKENVVRIKMKTPPKKTVAKRSAPAAPAFGGPKKNTNPAPSPKKREVPKLAKLPKAPQRAPVAPKRVAKRKNVKNATGKTGARKKRVSKAVAQARNLQNSLKGLLGSNSADLADVTMDNDQNGNLSFEGGSDRGLASGSVVGSDDFGGSNVAVGSDGPGGTGTGSYSGVGSPNGVPGGKGSMMSMGEVGAGGEGSSVATGLTAAEVQRVFDKHKSEIRNCYDRVALKTPGLAGKLLVSFKVRGNGRVGGAKVVNSTIGSGKLNNCVVGRLKKWQFPKPKGGQDVDVTYPFTFRPI